MAAVSITASDVVKGTPSVVRTVTASGALTAGQLLRPTTTVGTYAVAEAEHRASARATAMALNDAADGQPLEAIFDGYVTIGTHSLNEGTMLLLASTDGGIITSVDDLVSAPPSHLISFVGHATGTVQALLRFAPSTDAS